MKRDVAAGEDEQDNCSARSEIRAIKEPAPRSGGEYLADVHRNRSRSGGSIYITRESAKIKEDTKRSCPFVFGYDFKFMRDDYLKAALAKIDDPNILVNVVSTRVKQLRRGSRPLVQSLEKLSSEDIALREIIEGKITYEVQSAPLIESERKSKEISFRPLSSV